MTKIFFPDSFEWSSKKVVKNRRSLSWMVFQGNLWVRKYFNSANVHGVKSSNSAFPIVHYFTWKLGFVSYTLSIIVAGYFKFDDITKINVMSIFNYISYWLTSFGTLLMKVDSFSFSFSFEGWSVDSSSGQFGAFWFLFFRTEWSWWFCHFQILISVFFKIFVSYQHTLF